MLLSDLISPNLSNSFVESEKNSKLTHDNLSSTTSSLPSSASEPPSSVGTTFDLKTVIKKIEKAGSSNSWTKVINCCCVSSSLDLDGFIITICIWEMIRR